MTKQVKYIKVNAADKVVASVSARDLEHAVEKFDAIYGPLADNERIVSFKEERAERANFNQWLNS